MNKAACQEELLPKRRTKKNIFNSRLAVKEMHQNMTYNVRFLGKKNQLQANMHLVRLAAKVTTKKRSNLKKAILRNMFKRNANTCQHCVGI